MGALPGSLLQVVTTWNSMLELIWVVLPGPPLSLIARNSFRLHGWLPRAQLICCELYLVSLDASRHIFFVGASLILPTTVGAHLSFLLEFISFAVDVLSAFHSSKLSAYALMGSNLCSWKL